MDLKELESGVDPKTHWYYQSKKQPVFRYFEEKIKEANGRPYTLIDFGSGSGFFAIELAEAYPEHIDQVYLVDIGYTEEEMAVTKGTKVEKVRYIPPGIDFSIVLMMDVLEHIEDDAAILEDIKSRLEGDAWFFITVPAFMSVWSTHDVYLGHYRRYTIDTLTQLLNTTKCPLDKCYYLFGSIFPLVWLIRRLKRNDDNMEAPESSDMAPAPAPINAILKAYNSFEMNFSRANKLFGLTCAAEGRLV